jgi:hypothetical protein
MECLLCKKKMMVITEGEESSIQICMFCKWEEDPSISKYTLNKSFSGNVEQVIINNFFIVNDLDMKTTTVSTIKCCIIFDTFSFEFIDTSKENPFDRLLKYSAF